MSQTTPTPRPVASVLPNSPSSSSPAATVLTPLSESIRLLRASPTPSTSSSVGDSASIRSSKPADGFTPSTSTSSPISRSIPPVNPRFPRPALYPSALSTETLARGTPKERLNALLASDTVGAGSRDAVASSPSTSNPPQSRNFSSPVSQSLATAARPVDVDVPASSKHATGTRNISMDSVFSAASPSTANTKPNVTPQATASDSSSALTSDPAKLIESAGSAERAIRQLLKEKQAASTRSEQLWKLVEKQRTMILGLNKDLERALKDKERYRRKLKELPLSNAIASDVQSQPGIENNTTNQELKRVASRPQTTRMESGEDVTSVASTTLSRKSSRVGSPTEDVLTKPGRDSASSGSLQARTDSALSERTNESLLSLRQFPVQQQQQQPSQLAKSQIVSISQPHEQDDTSLKTPTNNPIHASALSASGGERTRKQAPAPLNLSKVQAKSTHFNRNVQDAGSESEYEAAESPEIERGRQRTREDDDRIREAVAIEEEERRSRSKKESKGTSRSKGSSAVPIAPPPVKDLEYPVGLSAGFGLPASPRGPLLGGLQSPMFQSVGSIASALHSKSPDQNLQLQETRPPVHPQGPTPSPPQSQAASVFLPPKSPGLPMSPRPGDRPTNAPMPRLPSKALPSPGPLSPRSGFALQPRPPKQPLPQPPATPLALASPHLARAEQYSQLRPLEDPELILPQPNLESPGDHRHELPRQESGGQQQIYRGFWSEQHPHLLLPPNALPLVDIKVYSSRLRPARHSFMGTKGPEEDPIFTLAVHGRSDNTQLWRVEKTLNSLYLFDQSLKMAVADFSIRLPDRSVFSGHAPAKIDARRAGLNQYFEAVVDTHLAEKAALLVCSFFSNDVIEPHNDQNGDLDVRGLGAMTPEKKTRSEGYLGKKGKQFGGWKSRYFIIEGCELRYYEHPGGAHLGNIRLQHAQIAKQNARDSDEEAEFRHAFLILEPKRKDSSSLVRHVLCAESDEERDEWVDALMLCVEAHETDQEIPGAATSPTFPRNMPSEAVQRSVGASNANEDIQNNIQSLSYEQTIAAEAPVLVRSQRNGGGTPSPTDLVGPTTVQGQLTTSTHPTISGPVGGGPIQNVSAWGNKAASPSMLRDKDLKKRSMFGFMSRANEDVAAKGGAPSPSQVRRPARAVFGIPLVEAAEFFQPAGLDILLPAPVYRCIEYLQAKGASGEEGIFRLSGSNVVIKSLRDRFNVEGDVKLLEGQYYDIHAVASLLKLYLRELPESVLTRELHLDFLGVLESEDRQQRANAINVLVHRLPEANFELLATLCRFLIEIVNNSEINKMNGRNVGIVFAPTLNIPAPLINLLLSDYDAVFQTVVDSSQSPISEEPSIPTPTSADDIRSPRKQMFTDLPTPAYNQTSFGGFQSITMNSQSPHNTGFVPIHQPHSYEPPQQPPSYPPPQHPQPQPPRHQQFYPPQTTEPAGGYSSLNAALAPTPIPTPSPGPPPGNSSSPQSLASGNPPTSSARSSSNDRQSEQVSAATKKSRRESTMLLEGRRKSSYQKLRDMAMAGVREET